MTIFNYALAALGCSAVATQTLAGYPAGQAIDGADGTKYQSPTGVGGYQYLTLDLGAPQYITELHILQDNTNGCLVQFEYSYDNTTWNVIGAGDTTSGEFTYPIEALTCRYWRIRFYLTSGKAWGAYYVELLGPVEAPPPPTNPADEYIAAWLDGLEANYVPAVQTWLDNN
jgi:hypothetical protein